jgi:MFS family permease
MQMTAQGLLIYDLTKSPLYLGYAGFAYGVPTWLFTLYGGVVTDKVPKKKLLLITQTTMMILALILGTLSITGIVQPWHILVLSFLLGTANAFEAPARIAFVCELVDREDLANAVALNTTMVHLATMIGPVAGALIYAKLGPGYVFYSNAASFLAVISALFMMKFNYVEPVHSDGSDFHFLKEGIRHVLHHDTLLTLMGIAAITSLFGISYATLFPAWADQILHGGAMANGYLQGARGAGALIAALYIASLGRFKFKGKLLTIGMFIFPIVSLIFPYTKWFPLSLLFSMIAGLFLIMTTSLTNTLCMTISEPYFRGRIMSVYSLAFFGFMPIGALWIGWLGKTIGLAPAFLVNTSLYLVFALIIFLKFPKIRTLE